MISAKYNTPPPQKKNKNKQTNESENKKHVGFCFS